MYIFRMNLRRKFLFWLSCSRAPKNGGEQKKIQNAECKVKMQELKKPQFRRFGSKKNLIFGKPVKRFFHGVFGASHRKNGKLVIHSPFHQFLLEFIQIFCADLPYISIHLFIV